MITAKSTTQKRTPGAIVRIPLDLDWHTYARILEPPLMAFYDCRTDHNVDALVVVSKPILFKIWVHKRAVTSGRWQKVSLLPLEPELQVTPIFFKQDRLDPRKFYLYRAGQEVQATREQCIGLERAAVWEPEHVEDRLRDHYLGRPNKWVESLKIRD
jgi:hypothetical protein